MANSQNIENQGAIPAPTVQVASQESLLKSRWALWLSLLLLLSFLVLTYGFDTKIPKTFEAISMAIAYLLAGYKTLQKAFRTIKRGEFFTEFSLMTVATLGAFYIGEYTEGVAVMVFYELGELFQDLAVSRSKRSIKALLDIRPDQVTVIRDGSPEVVNPLSVQVGEIIQVKPGEKLALDGHLLTPRATFNTAALTGESKPSSRTQGDQVLAGMINLEQGIQVEVTTAFADTKLSKILDLVQHASSRKAPTQLLISRLAKIYTPAVFFLALGIIFLPALFVESYDFNTWLYRGMVFLVIACPCALTVSIPLGYFGGIGLASRNGILFKGSNFLDVVTKLKAVVMDKTGTLTKGVFKVQHLETRLPEQEFLQLAASLESASTHPAARAIVQMAAEKQISLLQPSQIEEMAGHGLRGVVDDKTVLAGNGKLLKKFSITYPDDVDVLTDTVVLVAVDDSFAGYVTIADELKPDATKAVAALKGLGIEPIMLSGDKAAVVASVAKELGIRQAYGDLLPEGKVEKLEAVKSQGTVVAFVGDGVNDAPVIALADVGIAMGGLGSDAAIETADIVIQNDEPSKIVSAIKAGKVTQRAVWQNITLALVVKALVLVLGASGNTTLWEAVFADVGVALLAILNAYRIQNKQL